MTWFLRFSFTLIFIIVITLLLQFNDVTAGSEYTKEEKNALAKFRPMVKNIIYRDYMSQDEFLIRWLRARNLNLAKAKEMLEAAMTWRKENKIDDIGKEDFDRWKKDYPIYLEGSDKDGRPIGTYLFGLYNLRKVVLAGELDEFKRYLNRAFELTEVYTRNLKKSNISDVITIYDLHAFNRKEHLCLNCLSIYLYYTNVYESYYPQLSHKIYFVNMPNLFEEVLKAVRPLFSQHTREVIEFYDFNKKQWSQDLLRQMPSNQLYGIFGGTKRINKNKPL